MAGCLSLAAARRRGCLVPLLTLLIVGMITVLSLQMPVAFERRVTTEKLLAERLRTCDSSLATTFFAEKPYDASPDGELFRRRGRLLLAAVVRALDGLQLPHWLGSGTLLGYVRQCELVPAMGDVDLEVPAEAIAAQGLTPEQLATAVEAEGCQLQHRFGLPNDSLELAFVDSHGIRLDLFVSYPAPDGSRWIGGIDTGTLEKYKWTYPSLEQCWALLDGLAVGVPCDASSYLEAFYGTSWRSPMEGTWDYRTGHPNVHRNGFWPTELRSKVIVSNHL